MTEQWQPIETAPQDGTWVLTFTPSRVPQQAVMRWMPWATREQSKWETCSRQWYVFGPTHWTPLLEPPAADGESGAEEEKDA